MKNIEASISFLKDINKNLSFINPVQKRKYKLRKVLVANRGEIAKRFFLVLKEEQIHSVAVVTDSDRNQSWYEFADEVVYIGDKNNYINKSVIVGVCILTGVDAVYPGYGFLSEEYEFVEMLEAASTYYGKKIQFMGPSSKVMRRIGNKLDARRLAQENGVPLFSGSDKITRGVEQAHEESKKIGYPVIIKLDAGGGGKGMFIINSEDELEESIASAQRIGKNNYDNDSFYLEKFVVEPVHIEVQIFNGVAIGIRKCAVQRRNQKIIEESGQAFLDNYVILKILAAAENMAFVSGYKDNCGAGTVEFLYNAQTNEFGFLEMNARLQVEYAVTDESLDIDLAKWQVLLFDERKDEIQFDLVFKKRFTESSHAIQCRIYAEDSFNNYAPSPGLIKNIELPTFNGIRCDFGFKRGDKILPDYDPLIGKLISYGSNRQEAISRITRALSELYVRGITTNIDQLLRIVSSKEFIQGDYTNRILLDNDELYLLDKNNSFLQYKEEAAIFGTIAEYCSIYQNTLNQVFYSSNSDLQKITSSELLYSIPIEFKVEISDQVYLVYLIQDTVNSFEVILNGKNKGIFTLSLDINPNEILITHEGISYPVRRDQKQNFSIFRIIDKERNTKYYRMNITPLGNETKVDPKGMVRSPFQSSFVRLSDISVGSRVTKGYPVMVIAAMKMETTLYSPVDGEIDYIIENADISKLIVGHTANGLVKGRTISEGEILFNIKSKQEQEDNKAINQESVMSTKNFKDIIFNLTDIKKSLEIFQSDIDSNTDHLIALIRIIYMGLIVEPSLIENLSNLIKSVELKDLNPNRVPEKKIISIIKTYCLIKTVFSHSMTSSLSYSGELNQVFVKWDQSFYKPSAELEGLLNQLFRKYNVEGLKHGGRNISQKIVFFNMMRAYVNTINYPGFMKFLLDILNLKEKLSTSCALILDNLIQVEEVERDDFLFQIANKIMRDKKLLHVRKNRGDDITLSQKYFLDYNDFLKEPINIFNDQSVEDVKERMKSSLSNPESDIIPKEISSKKIGNTVSKKLDFLLKKFSLKRLYSYYPNLLVYLTEDRQTKKQEYVCFVYSVDSSTQIERDEKGDIISSFLEPLALDAIRVISTYNQFSKLNSRLEFLLIQEPIEINLLSLDNSILNYHTILKSFHSISRFFFNVDFQMINLDILAQNPNNPSDIKNLYLNLFLKDKKFQLDFMPEDNPKNPYSSDSISLLDKRIYEKNKWPTEVWIQLCFNGDGREIKIPSIDEVEWTNPKTNRIEKKPVGAQIYEGPINGKLALFFMKDSRINGGATGDLEGLKFAASCYYAYLKNLPLYVWNDGAGANIKEGVISLNRAGIGFMMNALLTHNLTRKQFFQYTKNVDDKRLLSLFDEIDKIFDFSVEYTDATSDNCFLVAVGIGSSTGLDVYGSSQAAIQVLLDDENSYRVLTGSNVIKSVTGEDLTNYEIGGARIMGNWTGTVDLVVRDKTSILRYIYYIHNIFSVSKSLLKIKRKNHYLPKNQNEFDIVDEEFISANIDEGNFLLFKNNYYNTGSLIGGFAKIGGNKALIMATRNNFGFRSDQCIMKAKELLVISKKMNSNVVLIFGDNWYQSPEFEKAEPMRRRLDFTKQLNSLSKIRINIITRLKGVQLDGLNAEADIIIFVKNDKTSQKELDFVNKVVCFVVSNLSEAFDIASYLISLDNTSHFETFQEPVESPQLPEHFSQPFDMDEKIIQRIVDKDSFIELYKNMNDLASGSSLITGLATIQGKVIGIIADQPVKGGSPDALGTQKFRIFTDFLNKHRIPLLMLSNAPGFLPGLKQERLRIQQIGGESLNLNVISKIPVVSVVLKQNFGGRLIHAFSRFLRPGIKAIALEDSMIAVMGASAAFDLFKGRQYANLLQEGKEEEARKMMNDFIANFEEKSKAKNDAYLTGSLDEVISDVKQLRKSIFDHLANSESDCKKFYY